MAEQEDRSCWVVALAKMAGPVLRALAARRLKSTMPVEGNGDPRYDRKHFSHLEAIARLLVGIAPWLECTGLSGDEERLRQEYAALARAAIDSATDPESPDYVNFSFSFQPIVDGAFLSHAILRAPRELWKMLEPRVQANLIAGLKSTRGRKPHFNNWLLFAAMIETGLAVMGADWDHMRVDYALRQHEQWYKGDGAYGDGADFHWDYYNSFVIQPMLVDIICTFGAGGAVGGAVPEGGAGVGQGAGAGAGAYKEWEGLREGILKRAVRYGEVQERMIAPDGTFPPLGRSLAYRCGAFQHLAQMALQERLGKGVTPEQVRCGLTAMIKRSLGPQGTYDDAGWLRVGFCGAQLEVGEMYISTGSLYLASAVFLPLGLHPTHRFWAGPATDWTAKRMWSGGDAPIDHALDHEVI